MGYDLKKIQKRLESVFDIKFKNDMFVDKKSITNTTNKRKLDIYIGMYDECVTWVPQREHIAFMWGKQCDDYHGMGRGFFSVDEVIKQMDKLGYPRRTAIEPEQLSLF